MTTLLPLFLAVAFQQAPAARTPQQPAPTPSPALQSNASQPRSAFDTTVAALTDVGTKVAEVRSAYELYRRAVFNQPDGAIVERANLYKNSCRALTQATRQAQGRICRTCLAANVKPSVEQYRANLPALGRVGEQCVARMGQLRGTGTEAAAAERMRADVRLEGDRLITGLRPYEARLTEVRRAMGWDQQPTVSTPRRGS